MSAKNLAYRLLLCSFVTVPVIAPRAQDVGPVQDYGPDGRLYSRNIDEHYLLLRQSYRTEDSVGYQGQFRIKKTIRVAAMKCKPFAISRAAAEPTI